MPNTIIAKIDVTKLDKSRFFKPDKPDKDGHYPVWADVVLFARKETGKFGDTHFIKQSKKRDDPAELPIIGNATERAPYGQQQREEQPKLHTVMNKPAPAPLADDMDVPF